MSICTVLNTVRNVRRIVLLKQATRVLQYSAGSIPYCGDLQGGFYLALEETHGQPSTSVSDPPKAQLQGIDLHDNLSKAARSIESIPPILRSRSRPRSTSAPSAPKSAATVTRIHNSGPQPEPTAPVARPTKHQPI